MNREKIKRAVPKAALYEQLAEECAELAQACIKMSRLLRKENPTSATYNDVYYALIEEFNDVALCAEMVELEVYPQRQEEKLKRWVKRLEEYQNLKM